MAGAEAQMSACFKMLLDGLNLACIRIAAAKITGMAILALQHRQRASPSAKIRQPVRYAM